MISPDLLSRQPSRRHFLRGMGVALALPWMESLPVLGQARRVQDQHAAAAPRDCLLLERRRTDSLVGEGSGRRDGARARPHADDAPSRRHGLPARALQPVRPHLHEPAPRPDERALWRTGEPGSQRNPRRDVDGSDPGVADRQPDRDPEPRARRRAERAAARRRPVDDLRLERVVDLAHASRRRRRSTRRARSIAWSATARAVRSIAASSTPCSRTRRA